MKKFLLFAISGLFGAATFAQISAEAEYIYQEGSFDEAITEVKMKVTNNSSFDEYTLVWERWEDCHRGGGSSQICDDITCHPEETAKSTFGAPIGVGESTDAGFKMNFNNDGKTEGMNRVVLHVYAMEDSANANVTIEMEVGIGDTSIACDAAASVRRLDKRVSFDIYPNPVQEVLTINVEEVTDAARVEIFNLIGVPVRDIQFDHMTRTNVNLSDLHSGTYWVRVIDNNGRALAVKKLTKI